MCNTTFKGKIRQLKQCNRNKINETHIFQTIFGVNEIKANWPVPYQNVCKRFAHDQSSWVVTGVKKIQELI